MSSLNGLKAPTDQWNQCEIFNSVVCV